MIVVIVRLLEEVAKGGHWSQAFPHNSLIQIYGVKETQFCLDFCGRDGNFGVLGHVEETDQDQAWFSLVAHLNDNQHGYAADIL